MLDALVLLGSKIGPGGVLLGPALRRARRALSAYRAGVAPWILATGGRRWYGVAESDAYARYLLAHGVPKERVLREHCSLTTVDNAYFSAHMLQLRNISRIGLVTCHWHMRRAARAFAYFGLHVEGLPADAIESRALLALLRFGREQVAGVIDARALGAFDRHS